MWPFLVIISIQLRHPYNSIFVASAGSQISKIFSLSGWKDQIMQVLWFFLSLMLFAILQSRCVPEKSEIDPEIEAIKDFWYFFTINEAGRFPWPRQYVCMFSHFNNILTMSRPSSLFHLLSFIIAWSNESREKKCWRWPRPQQVNAKWRRTDISGLVCILYLQTAFASVSQVVHGLTQAKFPRISKGNMTADGQAASEGSVSEHRCNRGS